MENELITIRLPSSALDRIDLHVKEGMFSSRQEAVEHILELQLLERNASDYLMSAESLARIHRETYTLYNGD